MNIASTLNMKAVRSIVRPMNSSDMLVAENLSIDGRVTLK
jgi:hypothetical protein